MKNPDPLKSTEFKRRAMCGFLNINFNKTHNINHEIIAKNLLTTKSHIDPLNICSKEDLKIIIKYMTEFYREEKEKEN